MRYGENVSEDLEVGTRDLLNRRTSNRGVDVYRPSGDLARLTRRAETWSYSNPQTQEAWQAP